MKYGRFPLAEAEGLILAHAVPIEGNRPLAKGTRIGAAERDLLAGAGVASVLGVRLEEGDYPEDEAVGIVADALALRGRHLKFTAPHTGRVNIHAGANGLFVANRSVVDRLNRSHPALTIACLDDHVPVLAGEMLATIKAIPLAIERWVVERWTTVLLDYAPFELKPYDALDVHMISTRLPTLKASVIAKTAQVLQHRLAASGSPLVSHVETPHDAEAVAAALQAIAAQPASGRRMVVMFGASAMADFDDVLPMAIRLAGGEVVHAGMPVDPGNLLVLGKLADMWVIGAPGCARSPKENGFDWILNRILAGEQPDQALITGMGVGGLLKEIVTRPAPREEGIAPEAALTVGAVVLAAGQARRMGLDGPHKLLAEFDGEALVRRSARIAVEAGLSSVVVVTGHRRAEIEAALDGLPVTAEFNPLYESGMASSLKAGVTASAIRDCDGAMILLADMPGVTPQAIRQMVDTFRAHAGRVIVRASANGKRGNPVILPRETFAAVLRLEGDTGARHIIEAQDLTVIDVEIGQAAHLDVDTRDAVISAGGILKG